MRTQFTTTHLQWCDEELTIRHPDAMPAHEARAIARYLLSTGRVPTQTRFDGTTVLRVSSRLWLGEFHGPNGTMSVAFLDGTCTLGA